MRTDWLVECLNEIQKIQNIKSDTFNVFVRRFLCNLRFICLSLCCSLFSILLLFSSLLSLKFRNLTTNESLPIFTRISWNFLTNFSLIRTRLTLFKLFLCIEENCLTNQFTFANLVLQFDQLFTSRLNSANIFIDFADFLLANVIWKLCFN